MSRKERCSHGIYGHFALALNLYRTLFLVKKISQTFAPSTGKIARLISEETRYVSKDMPNYASEFSEKKKKKTDKHTDNYQEDK